MTFSHSRFVTAAALIVVLILGASRPVCHSQEIVKTPRRARVVTTPNITDHLRPVKPNHVGGYGIGYEEKDGEYRCVVDKDSVERGAGVSYAHQLDQKKPTPLVVTGWKKARGIPT